ncbi:MAG: glycosyltransferase [Chryseolinea sp.]
MPRIVFLHYHGIGHLNPFFPLARILLDNEYEVFFAGVEAFRGHVEQAGFEFHPLRSVPFGLGFETWLNTIEKKKNIYLASLRDRISDRVYHKREKDLTAMLAHLCPDIILIDGAQITDFIVLYPHIKGKDVRVGIFHAMLPTHVLPGRPPANSAAFPEHQAQVMRATIKMKWLKAIRALKQKLLYAFFDDRYIVDRRIKKNKVSKNYRSRVDSLFYFNAKNIPELIPVPKEFDFPKFKIPAMHHYLGFTVNKVSNGSINREYHEQRSDILLRKHRDGCALLYCSFGTTGTGKKAIVLLFLRKLIEVAISRRYLLVISTDHLNDLRLIDSNRVFLFSSVSQVDMLSFSDLFITHGGLSSIKEAIVAEVPMLMYPVHGDYDPIGNSARVAYHELGLRGNIRTDLPTDIGQKVNTLLTDKRYVNNIKLMRKKNSHYKSETFIDLINNLPHISAPSSIG